MIHLFAILGANGEVRDKRKQRGLAVYRTLKAAKAAATNDGDSVVVLEFDHDTQPLFIRRRVLVPSDGE